MAGEMVIVALLWSLRPAAAVSATTVFTSLFPMKTLSPITKPAVLATGIVVAPGSTGAESVVSTVAVAAAGTAAVGACAAGAGATGALATGLATLEFFTGGADALTAGVGAATGAGAGAETVAVGEVTTAPTG